MSLRGSVYEIQLSDINSGQKLIFNVATDNVARYVREWNEERRNISKIVKVKHIVSHVRMFDFVVEDRLKEVLGIINHG